MEPRDAIVIGAGISGLLCAQALRDSGQDVLVLEKADEVGGRLCSCKFAGGVADHGAQLFTVRDLRFQMLVDDWLEGGICKRWYVSKGNELGAQGYVRYRGSECMADIPKWIAESLDVVCGCEVTKVEFKDNVWLVYVGEEVRYRCKTLILSAPLPLSLTLLQQGHCKLDDQLSDALSAVRYQKCMTVVGKLDQPAELNDTGAFRLNKHPINWIADNQAKGISKTPLVTIHSTPSYAQDHWRASVDERIEPLLKAAEHHLGTEIGEQISFEWEHAFPINSWSDLYAHDANQHLYLIGDAFGGPRVEGAALSGLMAAADMLV